MKYSNLGKVALLAANLFVLGNCATTGEAIAKQNAVNSVVQNQSVLETQVGSTSSDPIIQENVVYEQNALIEQLYPGLKTDLTLDIPEKFQDENGLFLVVDRNSEYYNETWNRGYAGMFTDEDKAGRSIKGYDISLPMQIFGNWSANDADYFERVNNPWLNQLYATSLMYYGDIGMKNHSIVSVSPYFELDKAYADIIKSDENLTDDEKLELIIMNHKGYLENLLPNIDEIIVDHYNLDKNRLGEVEGKWNTVDYMKFKENILLGVNKEMLESEFVDKFLLQTVASLEILKYRLPTIYENFEPQEEDITNVVFSKSSGSTSGLNGIYGNINQIKVFPKLMDNLFESYFQIFVHESIHYICKTDALGNFNESSDIANWLNNPTKHSEFITYGNTLSLAETLNFSSLYMPSLSDNMKVWYNKYSEKYHNGNVPMENFVRIIDNKN